MAVFFTDEFQKMHYAPFMSRSFIITYLMVLVAILLPFVLIVRTHSKWRSVLIVSPIDFWIYQEIIFETQLGLGNPLVATKICISCFETFDLFAEVRGNMRWTHLCVYSVCVFCSILACSLFSCGRPPKKQIDFPTHTR